MNYQYGITHLAYPISFHKREDIEEMAAHLEKGERITPSVVQVVKVHMMRSLN